MLLYNRVRRELSDLLEKDLVNQRRKKLGRERLRDVGANGNNGDGLRNDLLKGHFFYFDSRNLFKVPEVQGDNRKSFLKKCSSQRGVPRRSTRCPSDIPSVILFPVLSGFPPHPCPLLCLRPARWGLGQASAGGGG